MENLLEKFNDNLDISSISIKYNDINIKEEPVFEKINSILDNKLNDMVDRIKNNDKFLINTNIDEINIFLDTFVTGNTTSIILNNTDKISEKINNDLGIEQYKLLKYIENYKKSINKYFINILNLETKIYDKIKQLIELKKWSEKLKKITNLNKVTNLEVNEYLSDTINSYDKYIKSVCEDTEILSLYEEYELNKECFIQLVKSVSSINSINIIPKCTICLNNNVNVILLPCCHTCCETCINTMINNYTQRHRRLSCPICRKKIDKKSKIYYS